jgi:Predicted DNA modification methylase
MDAQLSLIMANQAQVVPGDLIFDPFVGSGRFKSESYRGTTTSRNVRFGRYSGIRILEPTIF